MLLRVFSVYILIYVDGFASYSQLVQLEFMANVGNYKYAGNDILILAWFNNPHRRLIRIVQKEAKSYKKSIMTLRK